MNPMPPNNSQNYPYPELAARLQFLCSPAEYRRIRRRTKKNAAGRVHLVGRDAEYWSVIPSYTYAECPLCHRLYTEPADTYSLDRWGTMNNTLLPTLYVRSDSEPGCEPPCEHFLGIHLFINLHDRVPDDYEYYNFPQNGLHRRTCGTGEIPRLTRDFFPDDIPSYAVLHALPICRIQVGAFAPSYTAFILTYLSADPKAVLRRVYAAQAEFGRGDPDFYPGILSSTPTYSDYQHEKWWQRY
ncbi:MAG: hypothetical protein WCF84_22950 [Anaerolineae bacterium]